MRQPETVNFIKQYKNEELWGFLSEGVFDSAILLIANLFDKNKNINFKNLHHLDNEIKSLPAKNICRKDWKFDFSKSYPGKEIEQIKNLRNKNIAHHERKGLNPFEWKTPVAVMDFVKKYLEEFNIVFLNSELKLYSLLESGEEWLPIVIKEVGITNPINQKKVFTEFLNFIK